MEVKRILYVITQAEWGGAQTYVFDLSRSFLEKGIEVGVVAGTEKSDLFNRLAALESDKLTLFREKHLIRAINPYHDFLAFMRLIFIIWKFKPNVVHLNSSKAGILGTMAAKLCRRKVIYTAHGFVFNENLSILIYLAYLWAEKISSLFRDKIIAVSYYDFRSAIEKKVIKPEKLKVIHNGVDVKICEKFLSKVNARGKLRDWAHSIGLSPEILDILASPETKIVGTIANFYENKGLKYLIESAGLLIEDMPSCIFILIGTGELENKLKKIIKDKRMEKKFLILGKILEASQYLKAFDIFCLPSIKEGLSYTLIEALMAGLPILTTDVGGNPEIVHDGENGFIIKPKDIRALSKKMKLLLQNDEMRNRMGECSLHFAVNYKLERMAAETMEVYRTVLDC